MHVETHKLQVCFYKSVLRGRRFTVYQLKVRGTVVLLYNKEHQFRFPPFFDKFDPI